MTQEQAQNGQTEATEAPAAGKGGRPRHVTEEMLQQAVTAAVNKAQATQQRQGAETQRQLDEAQRKYADLQAEFDASREYGDDPAKLQAWREKRVEQRAREEERQAVASEKLENARDRALLKGVPEEALTSVTTFEHVRYFTLGWEAAMAAKPAAPAVKSEVEEKPPAAVGLVTGGGGTPAAPLDDVRERIRKDHNNALRRAGLQVET